LGSVVFEFKRDLRQELRDVFARLPDYLAERERQTGRSFVGITTDGAEFITYELRGGNLVEISRHATSRANPAALLAWSAFGASCAWHAREVSEGWVYDFLEQWGLHCIGSYSDNQ
jgi:hypothetical protein